MSSVQCINCNVRLTRLRRLADESENLVNTIRLWTYPRDITPIDQICHTCWQLADHASSEDIPRRRFGHVHVCIVCGCSLSRIAKHVLSTDEEQRVLNVISGWLQPRQVNVSSGDETCIPCWRRAQRTALRNPSPQVELQPVPAEVQPAQVEVQPASQNYGDHNPGIICGVCGEGEVIHSPENIAQLLEHQQFSSMNEVCGVCWQQAQVSLQQNVRHQRSQHITLPNIRRSAETARHCIFQE